MTNHIEDALLSYREEGGELAVAVDVNRKTDPQVQLKISELTDLSGLKSQNIKFVSLDKLQELRSTFASEDKIDGQSKSDNQSAILNYFIEAVKLKSSDIHFTIREASTTVEMRIHGNLYLKDVISKEKGLALARTIIFSMCDIAEPNFQRNRRQDARISEKFLKEVGLYAARYSHIPTDDGLYIVMRTIANDSHNVRTLEELGFLPPHIKLLNAIQRRPVGMLLLSGPTGSGKSTTLRTVNAAWVERTKGLKRLITIEDPPEGKISGAIHTPVLVKDRSNPDSVRQGWYESNAAMVRLDPDAIMNGEIREFDSAMAAINAALTGHFMTGTIHANDAVGILERLVIMGVNKELLADAGLVVGLVSQRLVETLCNGCKISWEQKKAGLDDDDRSYLESVLKINGQSIIEKAFFHNPEGCEKCIQSVGDIKLGGINGRTVLSEIILPNAEFMTRYRTQGASEARNYWRNEMEGITRVTHALNKIAEGVLDPLMADSICPLDEDSVIYRMKGEPA